MKNVDLVLRLLYCAVAPIALAGFATQIPVAGIALGAGLATLLAVTEGQAWRESVGRIPLIGRVFRGPGKLGAYYKEHPPKPLIYYVLYPVLLPYVMFRPILRAEWRLYRKAGAIALVVTLVTAVVEYLRRWAPEIPIAAFLIQFVAIAVLQMLLTMVVIMPLVTTIILAHGRQRRAWIRTLAVLVLVSASLAVLMLALKPTRSATLDRRVYARASAAKERALKAMYFAAVKASAAMPAGQPEGLVDGAPLAAAQHELAALWKPDEVAEFRVWTTPSPRVVLVLEVGKRHPPLGFGVDGNGRVVPRDSLPPAAREIMKRTKLPATLPATPPE